MGSPPISRQLLRHFARFGPAAMALFLGGCGLFGPQSTIDIDGPVARSQLHLFYVTLGVTAFIFVTVGSVLAFAQIRFRARSGDSEGPPPQTHGHPMIEVGLIVASALLLVIIAVPTVRGIWYQEDPPDPDKAFVITATGYQWWFRFEYPGLGIVTANEMIIPTGRPVRIDLRTMDVIHSFWVPKLAGKKDLIPNRANAMWLQADRADYFWAQCAEFCGESHANMKFRVVALDEPEFSAWVRRQQAGARTVDAAAAEAAALRPEVHFAVANAPSPEGPGGAASPLAWWQEKQALPGPGAEDAAAVARGRQLFTTKTCGGCHTIRGHEAMGISAPDLTHFASRTTIAAGTLDNTGADLRRWLADPAAVKPGNLMARDGYVVNKIHLAPDELEALVAYLQSLK